MSFFNVFDREKSAQQGSGEPAEAQLNANVTGRVQGVGFRWWAKGEATPLGLVGYAKNLDDGSVEIVAQGSRENCQKLLDSLNSGNTAGHVDHVDAEIGDPPGFLPRFRNLLGAFHFMGHDHHSHGAGTDSKRLTIVVAIAWLLFAFQLAGAWITGSLALLFDTVHVFTDALSVTVALVAAHLAARPSSLKRTWGWKRIEVISAMFQAAILLGVGAFVVVEAIKRFFNPAEIPGFEVLIFGAIGLVGNLVMIAILVGGNRQNFNMRAAFLEVLNDALGSVAVIVSALVIGVWGWYQADAVVALFIGILIIPRTLKLLFETINVLLESTPPHLDLQKLQNHLESQEHVLAVHDLHASQISSDLPVLTAHVVLRDECFETGHTVEILKALQNCVNEHFEVSIRHSTFQLEPESLKESEHYAHLH